MCYFLKNWCQQTHFLLRLSPPKKEGYKNLIFVFVWMPSESLSFESFSDIIPSCCFWDFKDRIASLKVIKNLVHPSATIILKIKSLCPKREEEDKKGNAPHNTTQHTTICHKNIAVTSPEMTSSGIFFLFFPISFFFRVGCDVLAIFPFLLIRTFRVSEQDGGHEERNQPK